MLDVRSFLNADLRILYRIYVEHHAKFGPPPRVTLAQFEQAIFARTFFDPQKLLVATSNDQVVGWCHFFEQIRLGETASREHVIANLCTISGDAMPSSASESVSDQLMQSIIRRTVAHGGTLTAGIVRDEHWGYAGLEPYGAAFGFSSNDLKLTNLFQHYGFTIASQHVRLQVSTQGYRMPMSRDAMQWRRTCSIQTASKKPENTRHAAALSHVDLLTLSLVDSRGKHHASVDAWISDPEAEVMPASVAILNQPMEEARIAIDPAHAYLIGGVISELPKLGIQQVEMVLDQASVQAIQTLGKLGFKQTDHGIQFVLGAGTAG